MTERVAPDTIQLFDFRDPEAYARLAVIEFTGFTAVAHRHVHPPRASWRPVASAARYQLALYQNGRILGTTESDGETGSPSEGWDELRTGPAGWFVQAFDAAGRLVAVSRLMNFFRAPDFDPADVARPRRPWLEAAWMAFDAVMTTTVPKPAEPGTAPTFQVAGWIEKTAAQRDWPDVILTAAFDPHRSTCFAFPNLHDFSYVDMCEALWPYADAARRPQIERLLRAVGDHLLLCRLPADSPCAGMVYGCARNDGQPFVGLYLSDPEEKARAASLVEPAKCSMSGLAWIKVFELTGDRKYLDAALELAASLAKFQTASGTWPARLDGRTGQPLAEYSSMAGMVVRFLDRLMKHDSDQRWRAVHDRALAWMVEHPLKTFGWVSNFDDGLATATESNPYAGLSNYDMLPFMRYLCEHPERVADAAATVADHLRWNDDQFVFYGPDPLLPFEPWYPVVAEQGNPQVLGAGDCWVPMDFHTSNWALTQLEYHRLTGDNTALAKAHAAAAALTQTQMNDGRTITWLPDRHLGIMCHVAGSPPEHSWWPAAWPGCAVLWAKMAELEKEK